MSNSSAVHHGNQFKKILKQGGWYFTADILTKATVFLLLPVYTHYLSPEDYGIQNSLYTIGQLLPVFIGLSLSSAFGRYYYLEKADSELRVSTLYSTHFWFVAVWGTIVIVLTMITSPYLFQPLLEIPFWPYIPLAVIPPFLTELGILGTLIYRANLQAKEISLLQYLAFLVNVSIVLVLLIPFQMGIQARLYGLAAVSLINFVYFLIVAIRSDWLSLDFNGIMFWRSLRYALPLVPSVASSWIASLSDRLILAYYGEIAQVGLYSLSVQISLVLYMVNDAMTQVQGPIAMSALTENTVAAKKQISEFLSVYIWIILLFYMGLTFFSKELLYIAVDERYHLAYRLVPILSAIYILGGIYRIFEGVISFYGRTWIISSAAIFAAILNLILNFIFIPYYGQTAAAWTTLFSTLTYTSWIFFWAQKIDPIPINYSLIVPSFVLMFGLLGLQQIIDSYNMVDFWAGAFVKNLLIFCYIGAVFVLPSLKEIRINLDKLYRKSLARMFSA